VPVGQQMDYNHLCHPGGDRDILLQAMNTEGLYRNLEPMPGAVDAVLAMEEGA
jgi:5'-nucleotidase